MAITSIIPAPEGHRAALLPRRPERPKITPFVLDRWYHTVPVRLQMCGLGPYGWNVQLRLLQGGLIVFRWRASHLRSNAACQPMFNFGEFNIINYGNVLAIASKVYQKLPRDVLEWWVAMGLLGASLGSRY